MVRKTPLVLADFVDVADYGQLPESESHREHLSEPGAVLGLKIDKEGFGCPHPCRQIVFETLVGFSHTLELNNVCLRKNIIWSSSFDCHDNSRYAFYLCIPVDLATGINTAIEKLGLPQERLWDRWGDSNTHLAYSATGAYNTHMFQGIHLYSPPQHEAALSLPEPPASSTTTGGADSNCGMSLDEDTADKRAPADTDDSAEAEVEQSIPGGNLEEQVKQDGETHEEAVPPTPLPALELRRFEAPAAYRQLLGGRVGKVTARAWLTKKTNGLHRLTFKIHSFVEDFPATEEGLAALRLKATF